MMMMSNKSANAKLISAANNSNPQSGYRGLLIPGIDEDDIQPVYLVVIEPPTAKSKKSYYRIPLGEAMPNAKGEYESGTNIIVPIIPEVETIKEIEPIDQSIPIKHGYLYVFRNRKLWRELKAVVPGQFSDINLRLHQGKDKRPASGDKDRHLLLPYKIDGEECEIHIAYSTIQWGWRYICGLGGMDEAEDDRYHENLHSGKKYNKDHHSVKKLTATEFDERLQKIDLSIWKDLDVSIDADDRHPRMQTIKPSTKNYHRKIHSGGGLVAVTLADPVGKALSLSAQYQSLRVKLQAIHDAIKDTVIGENGKTVSNPTPEQLNKQHALFQTASFLTSFIYHDDKKEKSSLNETTMKKFLHSDEIIKNVEEIDKFKNRLIDHIEDITSPFNLTTAMKDMFALEDWRYLKAWDTIGNVLNMINGSPASQVEHLILDKNKIKSWRNKDRSEALMLSLSGMHPVGPQHPLSKFLFPDEVFRDNKNINDAINPLFNYEKIKAISQTSSNEDKMKWSKTYTVLIDTILKEVLMLPNITEANNTNDAKLAAEHKANSEQLNNTTNKLTQLNKKQQTLDKQQADLTAKQQAYEYRMVDASLAQQKRHDARDST